MVNVTYGNGGGIHNNAGANQQVTVSKSVFSGNEARPLLGVTQGSGRGGGLYNAKQAVITQVTFAGNKAAEGVAHYAKDGSTTDFKQNTVSTNQLLTRPQNPEDPESAQFFSASFLSAEEVPGAAVTVEEGAEFFIVNTIIAQNEGRDVSGVFTSLGHNLIGDVTGGSGFVSSDLLGDSWNPIDARLSTLDFHGGPTENFVPAWDSPAVDAGDNNHVSDASDQRGLTRIVNYAVDIGAVERQDDEPSW